MKATIVTTTIYVPKFLAEYSAAAERNGHDVDFIVIGDAKTPLEARGVLHDNSALHVLKSRGPG